MTADDATLRTPPLPADDDSQLTDTLPSEDLSADKHLRDVQRVLHRNRPMPVLAGIPLFRKLGEGGMGAVYYGVHLRLQREVAVKVMKLPDGDSEALARFDREARLGSRIQSPHLVHVHDVSEAHGLHFMVLEFVRGGSGADVLKQSRQGGQPLSEGRALDLCIAATKGLCAAHEKGVIHRDIKPANILIPKPANGEWQFGQSKLADLGLARVDSGKSLDGSAHVMGTPGFMAPEQAQCAKLAKKPADVFSMGAALYALLGGQAPFQGGSLTEVLLKTVQEPHQPIVELRPDVSPATRTLIDQCLAKEPSRRFADAFALLAALEVCRQVAGLEPASQMKAAAEMSIIQRRTEVGQPVAETAAPQPAPITHAGDLPLPSPVTASDAKRGAPVGLIVAAVVALAAIVGVVVAINHRAEPAVAPRASVAENEKTRPDDSKLPDPPRPARGGAIQEVEPAPAPAAVPMTTLPVLAKALGAKLAKKGVKKLAVLEFLDESAGDRKLGGKIGAAGKYFAEQAELSLADVEGATYSLIERGRLSAVLEEAKFQASDLAKPDGLKKLGQIEPVDAIVLGVVRRSGQEVQLTLKALSVPDGGVLAMSHGALPFTTDFVALCGESFYAPPALDGGEPSPKKMLSVVAAETAEHPLSDALADVPFRLEVIQEGAPLPFHKDGRDVYVAAESGKRYTLKLSNRGDRLAVVALSIDGLNTIGQKREAPSTALKWVLKPGKTIEIKGWQMGRETAREFVFSAAGESLAARKNFSSDIGLITAVFYRERVKRGTLGTTEGNAVDSKVVEVQVDYEETPAAVLNIKYDEKGIIEKLPTIESRK